MVMRDIDYYLMAQQAVQPSATAPSFSLDELMAQSYASGAVPRPQPMARPVQQLPPQRADPETMGMSRPPVQRQPVDQIPWHQKMKEHAASSGAAWSNFFGGLGARGRNFRADTTAPHRIAADLRNRYLNERRAMESLRQSRQPKSALNPLQQFTLKDKISQARLRNALNDPNSEQSVKARGSIAMLYPDFHDAIANQGFEQMTAADIQGKMFQGKIDDFYRTEELQEKSDIQLERQKSMADYTADLEREKAALRGGLAGEARRLRGEERVARGGTKTLAEGMRENVYGYFPDGYFEAYPERLAAVKNIEETSYKRGSISKENIRSLERLAKRAEQDMAYNIPGWRRVTGAETPELQSTEIKKAREAVAALNEIQPAIKRLKRIRDNIDVSDFTAAQVGYKTQEMADVMAIQEQLFNNLRIVGNYGVPQEAELRRMEKQIPSFDTLNGFINGIRQVDAMNKALTEKLKAKMEVNGWVPAGPRNRSDRTDREIQ